MATIFPAQAWPFPTGSVYPPATKPSAKKPPSKRASTAAIKGGGQFAARKPATKRAPTNHRAAWDAAADNQLITGFVAGMTPAALAKTCGRTKASVAGRLHVLGFLVFDKDTMTFSTAPKLWLKVA